jgi:uncharacterized protein YeaC (DUF1315 family)
MSYEDFIAKLTPDVVANLRRAIELGKWPDGRRITDEQRANCMEAVLGWELTHLPEEQRTGYIDRGEKKAGEVCASDESHDHHEDHPAADTESLLTWMNHDGAKH